MKKTLFDVMEDAKFTIDCRAEWMAAHNEQATALMVDFPEIAFYAPSCRMHTLVNPRSEQMLVEGNESGEATNVQVGC